MTVPVSPWRAALAVVLAVSFLAPTTPAWSQMALQSDRTADDVSADATSSPSGLPATDASTGGPIVLRQPAATRRAALPGATGAERLPAYQPGEFERFAQQLEGTASGGPGVAGVRRFGAELVTGRAADAIDYAPEVPSDYVIAPGDEVVLTIWGSVNADLRLTVDRAGRVSVPRVGTIVLAGVRYADMPEVIRQRVAKVFRNFELSASLGQLRSIRIYVTGFTARPGSYTVSSLSTIVNALMKAGGPSSAGSFRSIELRRGSKLVSSFDLYDLLIRGDKSADRVLQAEDVVHINAVGPQVAVIGSVNKPAVFELKAGESLDDVLRMAGGFSAVADRSRVAVERLDERSSVRISQIALPQGSTQKPQGGDVLRVFSAVASTLPVDRQNKRVRVEGEVASPGDVILPAGSTLNDALRLAGGLTSQAYLFGTELSRASVRANQQANYERALRDLETEFARSTATQRVSSADDAAAKAAQDQSAARLVERLRSVQPTGRIVLQINPAAARLPDLPMEDGDRIYIPATPTTIGVFGSVFNGGSYLFEDGKSVNTYVGLAGGPTRGADAGSTFVVRANGSVVSARQRGNGVFGWGSNLNGLDALPGDTVFVPEELNKSTFIQEAKDWTQILYQFGLGAAALKTIRGN